MNGLEESVGSHHLWFGKAAVTRELHFLDIRRRFWSPVERAAFRAVANSLRSALGGQRCGLPTANQSLIHFADFTGTLPDVFPPTLRSIQATYDLRLERQRGNGYQY